MGAEPAGAAARPRVVLRSGAARGGAGAAGAASPREMDLALRAIAEADEAPSLSRYIERDATLEQVLEFVAHRSAYQLKEADPHSWALPRMYGPPKAALVQIQADEYGGGVADRIHAQLFADTMEALGLDARYGAYVDPLPGVTLATVNLMSLFGLHRRWRGAIVGHLALFEMESSVPNRRYASGLRRLGCGERATAFFDEHVMADAIHEAVAAVDLAGGLARQQPLLTQDILWGAATLVELDGRFARHLLGRGSSGSARCAARCPSRSRPDAAQPAPPAARGRATSSPGPRDRSRRRSARGSARSCASRRRTAACATCRSGTARSSRGRPRSACRPGPRGRTGPRTMSGPSRYGVMRARRMAGEHARLRRFACAVGAKRLACEGQLRRLEGLDRLFSLRPAPPSREGETGAGPMADPTVEPVIQRRPADRCHLQRGRRPAARLHRPRPDAGAHHDRLGHGRRDAARQPHEGRAHARRRGQALEVLAMRRAFQDTMREDLIAAVERLTHRKVEAFLSDNLYEPDVAVEIFLLVPLD